MLQYSGVHYFCLTSNHMRYINTLISAKLFSLVSAASSTPPLLLLDVPFLDVEAVPVSPCLCPPRGLKTFTHKSTALPRLCLPNGLLTFTHKSTQDVLASAPPTFTRKSTALPRLCLPPVTLLLLTSQHKCAIQVHTQERATQVHGQTHLWSQLTADFVPFGTGSPLWHISFRGAVLSLMWAWYCHFTTGFVHRTPTVGLVLLVVQGLTLDTATGCHTGSHFNSFLSCLWCKSPAQLSSSLLPGATIYCVWLRSCHPHKVLSFLTPTLQKKINNLFWCVLSSVPVVHLPLTCLGSSEVCHRIGWLAVSFISGWRSWRSARGCFIPLQKLIVASQLEWALISSPVLQADWKLPQAKWSPAVLSHTAEEIPLGRYYYYYY